MITLCDGTPADTSKQCGGPVPKRTKPGPSLRGWSMKIGCSLDVGAWCLELFLYPPKNNANIRGQRRIYPYSHFQHIQPQPLRVQHSSYPPHSGQKEGALKSKKFSACVSRCIQVFLSVRSPKATAAAQDKLPLTKGGRFTVVMVGRSFVIWASSIH
jgi:hypothetical protein